MPGTAARGLDAVDDAIDAEAETAFSFLERLIRARSTVGEEAQAQGVVAEELTRLGFEVRSVPVPEQTSAHPAAGVRVGYPRRWSANEAFERVRAAVRRAAATDPWLTEHPPVLRQTGFRAQGYLPRPDHPLAAAIAGAHASAHGDRPGHRVLGSTTDARYYLNEFGRPALAYGPRARSIHAPDEAVDLASIVAGARTLARFIARFFADGGLPGYQRPGGRRRVRP